MVFMVAKWYPSWPPLGVPRRPDNLYLCTSLFPLGRTVPIAKPRKMRWVGWDDGKLAALLLRLWGFTAGRPRCSCHLPTRASGIGIPIGLLLQEIGARR